eukprot:10706469-Alexandrium_andersonii.AAC.1
MDCSSIREKRNAAAGGKRSGKARKPTPPSTNWSSGEQSGGVRINRVSGRRAIAMPARASFTSWCPRAASLYGRRDQKFVLTSRCSAKAPRP